MRTVYSLWVYYAFLVVHVQLKTPFSKPLLFDLYFLPPEFVAVSWTCSVAGKLLNRQFFYGNHRSSQLWMHASLMARDGMRCDAWGGVGLFCLCAVGTLLVYVAFVTWTYYSLGSAHTHIPLCSVLHTHSLTHTRARWCVL
jgi:hypothetical protein